MGDAGYHQGRLIGWAKINAEQGLFHAGGIGHWCKHDRQRKVIAIHLSEVRGVIKSDDLHIIKAIKSDRDLLFYLRLIN